MTVIRSSTKVGPLKKFTISLGEQRYSNLTSSPVTLPTSEPVTAQVSYTVQDTDLCTISPVVSMKHFLTMFASGKFTTAGQISYRMLKNSTSVANGTNASTGVGQYFNVTFYNIGEVKVGDVIELKIWSTVSDTVLDFHGIWATPSQPQCFRPGVLIKDLVWGIYTITAPNAPFASSGITPALNGSNTASCIFYLFNNATFSSANCASNTGLLYIVPNTSFGAFRSNQGDGASSIYNFNGSNARNFQTFSYVTSISFREVFL